MIHLGNTQIHNSGSTSELFKKIRLASKRLLCSEAMLTQLEVVISKLCCACMTEGHYIEADILLDTFKGNYGIQLTLSHVMKEANLPLAEDFFDAYLIKHQEDRTYQVCAIKYLTAVNSILDQNIFELIKIDIETPSKEMFMNMMALKNIDLASNKHFLQTVLENIQSVVYAKDLDGRYTYMNSQWERTMQLSRESSVGKCDMELFAYDIGSKFQDNDIDVMLSMEVKSTEEYFKNAQEEEVIFLSTKVPMVQDEKIIGLCGISTNITERKRLEEQMQLTHLQLTSEKDKADKLIKNVLPAQVAEELKTTGKTSPVTFEKAAVMFADLVGFTRISSQMTAIELIDELNDIFSAYDDVIENNHCERIKTIGDAYMAVSGLPILNTHYADNIVASAVQILHYLKKRKERSQYPWTTTIGIDSGEVVGGVVGVKKFIYDVFGTTVNMASRLQSASKIYKLDIIISGTVYNDLKNPDHFCIREIDSVRVKGEDNVIKLYEVFECDDDTLKNSKLALLHVFLEGLEDYKSGKFVDALEKFKHCQEQCPDDTLPPVYIKRCSTLMRMPLSLDWSGVSGI